MNGTPPQSEFTIALIAVIALVIGCGDPNPSEANNVGPPPTRSNYKVERNYRESTGSRSEDILPGAGVVRRSLARSEYDTAVTSLLALRTNSIEGKKYTEFLILQSEVNDSLRANAATDPTAAEWLAKLNSVIEPK